MISLCMTFAAMITAVLISVFSLLAISIDQTIASRFPHRFSQRFLMYTTRSKTAGNVRVQKFRYLLPYTTIAFRAGNSF